MVFGEAFVVWAQQLLLQYSYAAVFFLSFIGTSTIFIPFPLDTITSAVASAGLNPFFVGMLAGFGAAGGELVGYLIGLGGRAAIIEKKKKIRKFVNFFTDLFEKSRNVRIGHKHASMDFGFFIILCAAFLPFPFDAIGILSGISKYDIKKFYIAVAIGKISRALLIAYFGRLVIPIIGDLTGWF